MTSIEASNLPLAFPAIGIDDRFSGITPGKGQIAVRCLSRAMDGMQKQALVWDSLSKTVWSLACDEGPYLNGTDLAPFPLAHFNTGLAFSLYCEIEALAAARGVQLGEFTLTLDTLYSMEGSALKGTMTGGALSPVVDISAKTDQDRPALMDLVVAAIAGSPAFALMRDVFTSEFTLKHNGKALPLNRVKAVDGDSLARPGDSFDHIQRDMTVTAAEDIITKLDSAQSVFGVEGGAGSSLQSEQKRQLHIRGIAHRRADGLLENKVQLFKPIGSVFRFLGDSAPGLGGTGRAPSGLAYLSAGLAFCYMTQIGRFAHIMKQNLDHYSLVQDTAFSLPGASSGSMTPASAETVRTHVHIDSSEPDDAIQNLVDMGEQTCFLHAACRTALKAKIRINEPA
ncbi:hypothetical protein JCM17844_25160 [Iodidimonas gelatinilytica]|uniref:OsmC family peroxiredoxin n=1 Tax=Iodidimonas gelatinilytica TaxID=1236966 RepID=A0A5A7MVG3_9PROT|nr:OsmC family protein [Iodidimonas gelatinilytica]GEQ98879.1 hypothetical protein JCM17844_25160 [Iodidimonas gelatinilytica]